MTTPVKIKTLEQLDANPNLIEHLDPADVYELVKGIIHERAISFNKSTGINVDDCISFGNTIFLKGLHAWCDMKQKNNKFSSFLYWRLTRQLINLCQKINDTVANPEYVPDIPQTCPYLKSYFFHDSKKMLSKESQEMVDTILKSPEEFIEFNKEFWIHNTKKFFMTNGWKESTINKCFTEIKYFLKDIGNDFKGVISV